MVNSLPEFLYPEIASVLYSQLSKQHVQWLQALCKCGIVVSHVVSTTQLLMDSFRHCPSPVLLYMFDGVSRHRLLLTKNGLPLHMRQAIHVDESAGSNAFGHKTDLEQSAMPRLKEALVSDDSNAAFAEDYLNESLAYFSNSVFSSIANVLVVFPHELISVEQSVYPNEYLVQYLLGLECEVSYKFVSLVAGIGPDSHGKISLDSLEKNDLSEKIFNKLKAQHIKTTRRLKKFNEYPIQKCTESLRAGLDNSVGTLIERGRALALQKYTYVVCILFVLVVLGSSIFALRSFQENGNVNEEYAALKQHINVLEAHSKTLHASPSFIMDSIVRIQEFEDMEIPSPTKIMSAVASTVQKSTAVSLTGFSWSVLEEGNDDRFVEVNSVSIRDRYWGDASLHGKTMIEMTGKIVSKDSLRVKHGQLNDFIKGLTKSDSVDGLRVLNSPAQSASSSNSMLESEGEFKIQFSIAPI